MRICGIYALVNRLNGKIYVGASLHVQRRFVEHFTPRNVRKNYVLARAIRKYGRENFHLKVLEACPRRKLAARERFWIRKLKPAYNVSEGGAGNPGHQPETDWTQMESRPTHKVYAAETGNDWQPLRQ